MKNSNKYIIKGFYKGFKYVKLYRNYVLQDDDDVEFTTDIAEAYKTDLSEASKIVKYLRKKGFIDLSIEQRS